MSTQPSNHSLAEFGGGLDADTARKRVPASELRGHYDAERVHEAADEADTVTEAADLLRVKFEDAKHDLRKVERYDEFQSAQDLVEQLRSEESSHGDRFGQYKRGGR